MQSNYEQGKKGPMTTGEPAERAAEAQIGTTPATTQNTSPLAKQQHFAGEHGFPISDEGYNLVTALSNELEGLEKYAQYAQETGGGKFWSDVLELKKRLAELFTHEVGEHAREGGFGTGEHRGNR